MKLSLKMQSRDIDEWKYSLKTQPLHPWDKTPVPFEKEGAWAQGLVWTFWGRE
jgi:hypothetical protein